jgi:hypothetical protein
MAFRWAVALAALTGQVRAEEVVDPSVLLVPRDQLATQERQPFMNNGQIVGPDSPYRRDWPEYEDAIARFPDAASCLVEEERDKDPVDLTRFDWQAFESFAELEVCLSKVGTTIRDNAKFTSWLRSQGYQIVEQKTYGPYSTYEHIEGDVYYTYAYILFKDFKKKTPIYSNLWFLERWRLNSTSQHSAHIWTMENGTVVGIEARTNAD